MITIRAKVILIIMAIIVFVAAVSSFGWPIFFKWHIDTIKVIFLGLVIFMAILTYGIIVRSFKTIAQRDKLLNMLNRMVTVLLVTESKEKFETLLLKGMELIGRCMDVDRVQIWQNEMIDGSLHFVHKIEWLSEIGRQKPSVPINLHFPYSMKSGWENKFLHGEYINSPLSQLPSDDQNFLKFYEIKSIVMIPLFLQENFWGFFSLDDCRSERVFSKDEINILNVGGLLIANALLHNKMIENIRDANDAKSDFLAKMSHEMRTPLNAVIGFSEMVLDSNGLSKEIHSNIKKIYNAGATLLATVNSILDISKIEAGKLELVITEYDTASLINDIVTQNIFRIGERPIKFILDINENLFSRLCGDELRLKQIMNNLLSNAIKYTKKGSIEFRFCCDREGDTVWTTIQISDTGIGIRPDDLNSLFSDYIQLNLKQNREAGGTGLGLALTKKMSEMMGGSVEVQSEYGKGSKFTVKVKQKFVTDVRIGPEIEEKLKSFNFTDIKRNRNLKLVRTKLPYAKVLVVDDMQLNLDVTAGLMKPYEMQVDCVLSGQDAVERIRRGNPVYNAIFMDHMMPEMDGIEAADAIRSIGTEYAKKIPIIALTANAIYGTEEMFYKHGFQAFISKPIDIMTLDAVIKKWVGGESRDDLSAASSAASSCLNSADAENMIIEISGIDAKILFSLYGGDMDVYLTLLRSYVASISERLDKLRNVSRETLDEYVINVHGLKGASASIGAERIRETALSLETMAMAGDLDGILARNDSFIKDTENIVANIKIWLEKYGEENSD